MDAKVAIIGAGWYGCHLGMMLDAMGCDVSIFEKIVIFWVRHRAITSLGCI